MLRCIYVLAGAWLLLSGCDQSGPKEITSTDPPVVVESSHVDPETGNLIALWMIRTEGTPKGERVPVLVPHPYAIYILWPRAENHPEPADKRIFIFYDNVAKKSYQTRSFDAFLQVVANQPRDITLLQIDTCTVSRCHMPREQWHRLERVLADGNRRWAVSPCTRSRISWFCYCEFQGGFIYPGDKH